MKTKLAQFVALTQKIDRRHIQIAFTLLALALFMIGAGAPDDGTRGLR